MNIYPTREAYALKVWRSLDAQTQDDILADYGIDADTLRGQVALDFLAAFADNMDARHNGTVTFTAVEGGYLVDDEAGTL
jgi:hypothetical protein